MEKVWKSATIGATLALLVLYALVALPGLALAQAGGRAGGMGGVSGIGRGGGFVGGGARGGVIGGGSGRFFHSPRFHRFGRPHFRRHHFGRSFVFFGVGTSVFYPAWWYDPYYPYYYWYPPVGIYSGYYGYPYYDYYGAPYWADPCLSGDPAYAPYCPPAAAPPPEGYGMPPAEAPEVVTPTEPVTGSESAPPSSERLPPSSQ